MMLSQEQRNVNMNKLKRMQEVYELYSDNLTQKEIAETLDISASRVSQIIKEINSKSAKEDTTPIPVGLILSQSQVKCIEDRYGPGSIYKLIYKFIGDLIDDEITINYGVSFPNTNLLDDSGELNNHLEESLDYAFIDPTPPVLPVEELSVSDVQEEILLPSVCKYCGSDNIAIYEEERNYMCNDCLGEESY